MNFTLRCSGREFAFLLLVCLLGTAMPLQGAEHEEGALLPFVEEEMEVTGTVTDAESGEPLIGVNIYLLEQPTVGTVTDFDGNYTLTVPDEGGTLVFSYTGYRTVEEEVGNRTTIDVVMGADYAQLEEVVVIGYGSQKKRDVTAAISSVDSEDIAKIQVASTTQALQGQVAGLDVQSSGGRPGQQPSVRIRGRRSISASNEPLYVVDGIPLTSNGTAFDINPQDIQSVEVLKDAAATSVYGSRGANGVILITTKRGSEGRTSVTYDGYYGISEPNAQVDMMNGEQFAAMKWESRRRDQITGQVTWQPTDANGNSTLLPKEEVFEDPAEFKSLENVNTFDDLGRVPVRSTDYQDLVLDQGHQQNHQVSIRGGNERTQFLMGFNYFQEKGVIPTQDYNRFSLRLNLDHQISNWLKIGTSTYVSRVTQNWASNPIGEALANNPLGVPYDEEGNLLFLPISDGIRTNPLAEIVPNAYVDERLFNTFLPSIYAEADILEGLTYKITFGPEIRFRRQGLFQDSETNARRGGPPRAQKDESQIFSFTLENLLSYNKQFGQHGLSVSFLQSIQQRSFENTTVRVNGLPFSSQLFNNLSTAETIESFDSDFEEWQLASFMGRVSYDLAGKYLLQVSARADGSSRLSPGNKWEVFPGVSVGWRIVEEPFMQNNRFLSDLKLRASWGVVGNTAIDPYQTQGALDRTAFVFGESSAFGYRLGDIPNPDLTWEKTATFDVGLDFAFWNGRVNGSVDYYISNTTDLLLERQLPPTSGYTSILENVGETRNTGIEISLETVNFDTPGGFFWSTNANFFRNTEEIVQLFIADQDDIGNQWFIGQPIGVFFDFEKVGIWQADEADLAAQYGDVPGEIKLNDRNNNGEYDGDDRTILGTDIPDFQLGLTNTFEYKGFDFSFFLFFRMGHMIFSSFHTGNNTLFARYNNLNVDYWTPDNPTNAFPRPNLNQERPKYNSTMGYFDGSYIKLRNVQFGYSFQQPVLDRLGISRLRVYVAAQNPWFWSRFDTYDPETNQNSGNNRQANVSGDVPGTRLFLGGINLSF